MAEHASVEIITPYWAGDVPLQKNMQVYVVKLPDIPKEINAGKDMMGGESVS